LSLKNLDDASIRMSNRYYADYGALFTVENLSWSADRILQTCDETLRDKVREGLVGVSTLEGGGPIGLKLMLDVVMDIDDSSLRSLTQGIQTLRLKDVPGEIFGTVVLYLKGAIMLLQN